LGKGPNDLLRFGNADDVIDIIATYDGLVGFNIYGGGGNDTITGSDKNDTLEGGTGSDTIAGGDGVDYIYGGKASGSEGKDRETTGNLLYGEAEGGTVSGDGTGYGDFIFGADGAAGVDTDLRAGNFIYGDYATLTVNESLTATGYTGGGDTIYGGNAVRGIAAVNEMIGDVGTLTLASNAIYTGGIDTIYGGAESENTLYGDVINLTLNADSSFTGGADILVSGTDAIDTMYGDTGVGTVTNSGGTFMGGEDTFVFGLSNGDDTIWDFRTLDGDKINLFDTGLQSFADLEGHIIENLFTNTTTIDLGQAIDAGAIAGVNTITVVGVTGLVETDFEFIDWMTA